LGIAKSGGLEGEKDPCERTRGRRCQDRPFRDLWQRNGPTVVRERKNEFVKEESYEGRLKRRAQNLGTRLKRLWKMPEKELLLGGKNRRAHRSRSKE